MRGLVETFDNGMDPQKPSSASSASTVASGYAALVASISNRIVHCAADQANPDTATDGTSLTTSPLISAPSVGAASFLGSPTWENASQNSLRGFISDASGERALAQTGLTLASLMPTSADYTIFCVEKRSGTQGANTGDNRYTNSRVVGDASGYFGICFDTSSRDFLVYQFPGAANYISLGVSFTDAAAYVLAVRVSGGVVRVNFNGTTSTVSGTLGNPTLKTGRLTLNDWTAGTNRGYEYLLAASQVSNATMDAMVAALKTKWGIS
jgi:hypothetical protein